MYYRNNFSFFEIDRFFYLWVLIFYFYIFIYFSEIFIQKKYIFIIAILISIYNYNFFIKYLNYENETNTNTKLFLPIKKILINSKVSNDINLNINSTISVNKFDKTLYPYLNQVNFVKKQKNTEICTCDGKKINIFITKNLNEIDNFCKIRLSTCKKIYSFNNKLYYFDVFK